MTGCRWFLLPFLFCAAWQLHLFGADTPPTVRKISKEPTYQTKTPRYVLLVFGKDGKDLVWMVHDGDLLYVDRNGNGDFTEPGERIERLKPRKGFEDASSRTFEVGELKLGELTHKGLTIVSYPLKDYANAAMSQRSEFKATIKQDPEVRVYRIGCDIEVPGINGGGQDGRLNVLAGPFDAQGFLTPGKSAASAPVIRLGGPIQVDFPDRKPQLRPGYPIEMLVSIGFPGKGPGTFAAIGYEKTLPPEANPVVEIEVASAIQGAPPYRNQFELPSRCCMTSLYGPVRVDSKQLSGNAIVTLTLPGWKEGQVIPTRHSLAIVKGAAKHGDVTVSSELAWTIRHPERMANIMHQKYSPDGKRLFLSGYPSGIVQIWDLENRKEIHRVESIKGFRGSSDYAHITPDGKTLLIGDETRKVKQIEDGGKKETLIEYSGKVQVWDAETGEQRAFLHPASGYGAGYCQLTPDGKKLVLVELKSYLTSQSAKTSMAQTSLWDLQTGERRVLGDDFMVPNFSGDSRFGFFAITNLDKKTSIIKKIDLASGKTLAQFHCADQDRHIALQGVSPDERWLAAKLPGKWGAEPITLFLDTATLTEKSRLILAADPKARGWQPGSFSPDGKIFETSDGLGNIHLWSLEEKKVIRVIAMENGSRFRSFSPDGKFLAIAWMPKYDESLDDAREPDPLDLPQPRISLIDLHDPASSPIVLTAPHGYCGSLAFRPDGKQLSFGSSGGVHLFDVEKVVTKKEKP